MALINTMKDTHLWLHIITAYSNSYTCAHTITSISDETCESIRIFLEFLNIVDNG